MRDHHGHAGDLARTRSLRPGEHLSGRAWPAGNTFLQTTKATGRRDSGPAWTKRNPALGSRGSPSFGRPAPTGRDSEGPGPKFHFNYFRRANGVIESS